MGERDILTWREGGGTLVSKKGTSKLTRTSSTKCTLVTKDRTTEGTIKADGKLHWSDGDVWSRILPVGASQWIFSLKDNPEIARYEREMIERHREEEKEKEAEANVYIGKPDLPPSFMGGGWGGPKEGNDTDDRFMLRGEARQLPENLYKRWEDERRFKTNMET